MLRILPVIMLLAGTVAGIGAGVFLTPGSPRDPDSAAGPTPDAPKQDSGHGTAPSSSHSAESDPVDGHGPGKTKNKQANGHGTGHGDGHGSAASAFDYVKISNQFVVPVVQNQRVVAMVVLSLSLEVSPGTSESVYALEPKLRDGFLQVLFDHANIGGFSGAFTDARMLSVLRRSLLQVARRDLGDIVNNVLIVDIARQDV